MHGKNTVALKSVCSPDDMNYNLYMIIPIFLGLSHQSIVLSSTMQVNMPI